MTTSRRKSRPTLEKGFTNTMNTEIGFIGLGAMGEPMAANLVAAGYRLRVYNRTASKADALVKAGATRVERPGDAAPAGGVVITMLADD
ncbi:MAG: NAD(P)-binding domain-containing protein, partial [Candidatus Binataceae bacterium]